jgi:tetratricopeptide (TPR) repeat protein
VTRKSGRLLLAALLAAGCRTAAPTVRPPAYRLDPRTGLPGPFAPEIAEGWERLGQGRFDDALRAFDAVPGPAGAVGRVQVLLELGRLEDAQRGCGAAFAKGIETAAILAVCGETAGKRERWPEAYDLFEAALLRAPGNEGLLERKQSTGGKAVRALVEKARDELKTEAAEARADSERALAIAPADLDALKIAGRAAAASGDEPEGFERLHEAWRRDPSDLVTGEEAGDLALKIGRGDAAFEIFSALARVDPRFRARAQQSQEDFVISNWPARERAIAAAPRLTRAGAMTLLWRLLPAIRTAPAPGPAPVASDILARGDQRMLSRGLQLGLLDVDTATHRARPDAFLTRGEAARILLRAGAVTGAPGAAACAGPDKKTPAALAAACGILPPGRRPGVSGTEFRRAIAFLQEPSAGGKVAR